MNAGVIRSPQPGIMLAGGGSGGHISPGLAIAERLRASSDEPLNIVFACSTRPIDAHMLGHAGERYIALPAQSPAVRPAAFARFVRGHRASVRRCRAELRASGIQRVVALGGFVSVPAVRAAHGLRIPVTLINLDDPPGRANRWMARWCTERWSAVELPGHARLAEAVVGLPLRRAALAPADAPTCRARLGLDPDRPTLLVTGASQGATSINAFMFVIVDQARALFDGWQILHLSGPRDVAGLRAAYSARAIPHRVEPFLDAIGVAWGAADLAITRAGANSVAEVEANAVPALFVPYPYHKDQHQWTNARRLARAGLALAIRDEIDPQANAVSVAEVLTAVMQDAGARADMRARLEARRPPDAASGIARRLLGNPAT